MNPMIEKSIKTEYPSTTAIDVVTTKRGKYRSMELEDLYREAHNPAFDLERTKLRYRLPVLGEKRSLFTSGITLAVGNPTDETGQLGWLITASSPQSHAACFRHAIDFLVPDGTPVVAMQDGVVEEVQESSDQGGDNPDFRDMLNYLTIKHPNGERTQYCHLAHRSVSALGLTVKDQVHKGQPIATVGKTGWTDRDHLHVISFRGDNLPTNPFGFKSLVIQWDPATMRQLALWRLIHPLCRLPQK